MKKVALFTPPGVLCFGLIFGANSAYAAAGGLDPSFGTGGKVETGFGNNARPEDAILQPDGKIVVVGALDNFQIATQVFAVVRYLPNGRLDGGFGQGGSVVTAFTNFINSANAVAIQPDGKIVVAGEARSADGSVDEFALARYDTNGRLDTSFGAGGKVTTDFLSVHAGGFHEAADVILLQPDGKILVGGIVSPAPKRPSETALARYNANGSLDTTFGNVGEVAVVAIGNVSALALLSDGQILALNNTGGIAQFKSDGSLVATVTGGTIIATAHTAITDFQLDGKFLLAVGARGPSGRRDSDVKVVRFEPTGGADPGFNSPAFDFGPSGPFANVAQAVAVEPDGRIVVGGISYTATFGDIFGLARLNADGTLDSTFGAGGRLTTQFAGSDQVLAVLVQPDGKIIAVGQTFDRSNTNLTNLALARYLGH